MSEEQAQMKISIVHISDLHRDPKNPISNDTLLNSLIQDVENSKNEEPAIPAPQIIIASGDIIQGTGKDTINPEAVIREQYEQAELFLGELTDKLLGGDRQKLVITPAITTLTSLKYYPHSRKLIMHQLMKTNDVSMLD